MGVLNFSTDNLITGANIIDGNLYWTDNRSEPKKLEIDTFREYNHTEGVTRVSNGAPVLESDLAVIKLHPFKIMDVELVEYVTTPEQPEPPFESIFPMFAYRWRFEDGQYSAYSPFTQAAFIPQTRDGATTDEENYTEGFNTTMFNNVGKITLNNISRGPRDVVAVDILYTESISSTIYVLETLEIPESQRGLDFQIGENYTVGIPLDTDYTLLPLKYELSARKIYSALPGNQLTRAYDEVPQRAKAQEITANRLVFGNYQIGYDQDSNITLDSEFISAGTSDGLHVKGNRSYEVGVAYIDAYGRQGPMLQAGSITNFDGTITEQIPLTSDFNQTTRQQIQSTITSDPPVWADRYRYFIKDPAMDHHNLISYNIYNDGGADDVDSEFIWVEFQSTDRNKVQGRVSDADNTVLTLRRTNDTISAAKQRFLVQDIEGEAPEDVRTQLTQSITNVQLARQNSFSEDFRESAIASGTPQILIDGGSNSGGSRDQFQNTVIAALNRFTTSFQPESITDQQPMIIVNEGSGTSVPMRTVDVTQLTQRMFMRFRFGADTYLGGENRYTEVTLFTNDEASSVVTSAGRQVAISLGQQFDFSEEEGLVANGMSGLPPGADQTDTYTYEIFTTRTSDEAIARLGGRFWVKTARNGLTTAQSEFTFDGELVTLQQFWFETEPIVEASQLDLFWESSDTFCVCTEHGWPNQIEWYNCIAEVQEDGISDGVYLESTRINDKFNTVQLVKGVKVNVPQPDNNNVINRPYGLTWSGIYNGRTSVNRLNQFITADGITKELEPNYGSLQKLHTRDTNLIAITEDKVFRIQADKDQLFNADGSSNVTASNAVLGQTIPVIGEYGISTNPESFASYGHNTWFTDAKRGVVLQYTPGNGQLFEISEIGLKDFFRDRLFSATNIIGSYDDYGNTYVLTLEDYNQNDAIIGPNDRLPNETNNVTWKYETTVKGWPSRLSFIQEGGASLNNKYYTWSAGQMYLHNSNTFVRNNFYGVQYDSEIEFIFNDNPSSVTEYLTLAYEGTEGWEVNTINTESEDAVITSNKFPFVSKEGKFFTSIVSEVDVYGFTDRGLGSATADDGRTVFIQGQQDKSGIKGFYNVVRLSNSSTEEEELFSVGSETFLSSN